MGPQGVPPESRSSTIRAASPRRLFALTAAALALVTVAVAGLWFAPAARLGRGPEQRLAEIAAGLDARRPVEGRLALLPGHAPRSTGGTGAATARRPIAAPDLETAAVLRSVRQFHAEADGDGSPSTLQRLATADLIVARWTAAVDKLERAVALAPDDAGLWSDLAAARLARAEEEDRPFELVAALGAADRARRLAPDLPEAAFNRALALSLLHLDRGAAEAWRSAADLEPDDGWRQEAATRLAAVSAPTALSAWAEDKERLRRAARVGETATVDEIVAAYPSAAPEVAIGDLLVGWAQEESEGNAAEAAANLAGATLIGRALAAKHGDFLVLDAVASAGASPAGAPASPRRDLTLAGVAAYGEGRAHIAEQEWDLAEERFAAAEAAFTAAGNPLAGLAAYYRAIGEYYRPDYARAERSLAALRERIDGDRHPTLAALTVWMLGLCRFVEARPTDSLLFYTEALETFRRAGYPEGIASAETLLASAYGLLGQRDAEWRHRLAALAALPRLTTARRPVSILGRAGDAAAEGGEPEAALTFYDEEVAFAEDHGGPLERVVAHHDRSRGRSRLGDRAGAEADLTAAWRRWEKIAGGGLKTSLEAEILRSEGELPLDGDPQRVLTSQTRALDFFRASGKALYLADAYASRARAYLATGDDRAAEADLRAGIDEVERQRARLVGEGTGIDFFAVAKRRRMFDDLAELLAFGRGRPNLAFDVADRGRARALLDRLGGEGAGGGNGGGNRGRNGDLNGGLRPDRTSSGPAAAAGIAPLTLEDVQAELPERTALLVYSLHERRTLVWTVTLSAAVFTPLDLGAAEITARVDALRRALADPARDGGGFTATSAELYDLVLRPALAAAGGAGDRADHLVLVPDGALAAVPFAALVDRDTGRFLIERYALSLAPSVRVYRRALARSRRWGGAPPASVLAVGEPAYDRRLFPRLPPLPRAADEAAGVAALYPRADLLIGERADLEAFRRLAGSYEVLHFAGHALASAENPGYSALLLAPAGGEGAGTLFAHEVSDLDLAACRLVVLAACDTGAGPVRGGEGVLSLARAFLAAGAPAVVESLWPVDDEAGAELFKTFHTRLRAGADPASALQAAQLALLHHPDERFQLPAKWAGFAVIGGVNPQPSNQG